MEDFEPGCGRFERSVLGLLLCLEFRGPWSVGELVREIGNEQRVPEAVASLHAAGLVHRCEEFVWPTRSAARFSELTGGP
ncbi:MAG TPA: hypothetical protein VES97_01055 [Solirubrobacteraceae bacterium]|nr:hypothetical protein [Solirubrobacteraceae bacterium]